MQRPISVICMVFVLTILIFYRINPAKAPNVEVWDGKEMTVTGKILEKERKGEVFSFLLEVDSAKVMRDKKTRDSEPEELPIDINKIYVEYRTKDLRGEIPYIGEVVQFSGAFKSYGSSKNPGGFDASFYYYSEGIFGKITDASLKARNGEKNHLQEEMFIIRQKFADSLTDCVKERYSGILKAMLLGMKSEMNTDVKTLFYATGIGHILAISGLHISTIGRGIYGILKRVGIPVKVCGGISILIMILYGQMTGMSHSAYRAVIMFSLALTAEMLKKTYDSLIALSISAMVILLENPLYLYQSGFLLSFCAVLGTAILAPTFRRLFLAVNRRFLYSSKKAYIKEKIISSLIIPFSIQLFTIPVQMYFFYEISVYSLVINMLVLPFMAVVLVSGLLGMCVGVFHVTLGEWLIWPAEIIMGLYERVCSLASEIPGAVYITGKPGEVRLMIYFALMTFLSVVIFKASKKYRYTSRSAKKKVLKTAYLLGCIVCFWFLIIPGKRGNRIIFFDVGQGDGICILTEPDNCILVDGGSTSQRNLAENVLLPALKYYGAREIDYSIITHPDKDHYSGIVEILEKGESAEIKIQNLILPYALRNEEKVREICELAQAAGTRVAWLGQGDVLTEEEALAGFECLAGDEALAGFECLAEDRMMASRGVSNGSGLKILCVHPRKDYAYENINDASLGLYLSFETYDVLLMGDIEEAGSTEVAAYMLEQWEGKAKEIEVLKVAHHGSKDSTPEAFLEVIQPTLSIISCGERNVYGHPHEETLYRLAAVGSKVMTTAGKGAIVIEVGDEVRVRRWG